jgi:hypothetical protein
MAARCDPNGSMPGASIRQGIPDARVDVAASGDEIAAIPSTTFAAQGIPLSDLPDLIHEILGWDLLFADQRVVLSPSRREWYILVPSVGVDDGSLQEHIHRPAVPSYFAVAATGCTRTYMSRIVVAVASSHYDAREGAYSRIQVHDYGEVDEMAGAGVGYGRVWWRNQNDQGAGVFTVSAGSG